MIRNETQTVQIGRLGWDKHRQEKKSFPGEVTHRSDVQAAVAARPVTGENSDGRRGVHLLLAGKDGQNELQSNNVPKVCIFTYLGTAQKAVYRSSVNLCGWQTRQLAESRRGEHNLVALPECGRNRVCYIALRLERSQQCLNDLRRLCRCAEYAIQRNRNLCGCG